MVSASNPRGAVNTETKYWLQLQLCNYTRASEPPCQMNKHGMCSLVALKVRTRAMKSVASAQHLQAPTICKKGKAQWVSCTATC